MSDDPTIRLSLDPETGRIHDEKGREYRLHAVDLFARLKAERDAYLAYAALLQMEATMPAAGRRWTPEAAVAHAAEQATLTVREMAERGWSAGDAAGLMDCRDAVRERDSPEPPA